MKHLLLMRHAKSSWGDASLPDHARPLNDRGRRDAPRMGKFVRDQGLALDAVLCSTAARARATAEGFLQGYPFAGEVDYLDELYGAGPETIILLLRRLPGSVETALVIAHNPGLDSFLATVCKEDVHLPTAAIAFIKFPVERWAELNGNSSGELAHLWKPKEI